MGYTNTSRSHSSYNAGDSRQNDSMYEKYINNGCRVRGLYAGSETQYGKLPPHKITVEQYKCGQSDECMRKNQYGHSSNARRSINSGSARKIRRFDPYFMVEIRTSIDRTWDA